MVNDLPEHFNTSDVDVFHSALLSTALYFQAYKISTNSPPQQILRSLFGGKSLVNHVSCSSALRADQVSSTANKG